MKEDVLISFKNVNKQFQTEEGPSTVLKNINFEVKRGSFTIIYGPSGSGKSTLLNVLVGLERPTSGIVEVDGVDIYALTADERARYRANTIGMVYQSNNWVASLSAIENIALPLYLTGRSRGEALGEAKLSLQRVGLDKYANYRPTILSGGQQQRISLARATVVSPTLLIADEPTGNLDTKNGDMVMNLLTQFRDDFNSTIVLVTHNLEYLPLSDHRISIKDGVVTQDEGQYQTASNTLKKLQTRVSSMASTSKSTTVKRKRRV